MNAPSPFRGVSPLLALFRATGGRLRVRASWSRRRALATLALIVALAGVAAVALLAQSGGPPQTAFARAPSGQYAVVAKNTGGATVVTVVGTQTDAPMEIATVPHLYGFSLRGAVSPGGGQVALIAPDGAIGSRAIAALLTLDLETGEIRRLAEGLEPLQDALWAPDSAAVVVTRNVRAAAGALGVAVVRVDREGVESVLELHQGAVTVAPLGFDAEGRLLAVRLDARGSTLTRDGTALRWLSTHVTRDWSLSPDGTRLAFVEVNLWEGVRYLPRVVSIAGGSVGAASTSTQQALGTAWAPAGRTPRFGREPHTPPGSVSAQGVGGFDVPLGYSGDGASLAVRHWSGVSFDDPGTPQIEILSGSGRQSLEGFTRFFGWSAR